MIRDAIEGAAAGLAATAPMTVVMRLGFQRLPSHEKYPLPPRQIVGVLGRAVGIWDQLSEPQKRDLIIAAHFSYGTAMGAGYGVLARGRFRNWWTGVGYGFAVWAGSYLGLLPSLGILDSATEHPAERNALMIIAHLVWGAVLGGTLQLTDTMHQADARSNPTKGRMVCRLEAHCPSAGSWSNSCVRRGREGYLLLHCSGALPLKLNQSSRTGASAPASCWRVK